MQMFHAFAAVVLVVVPAASQRTYSDELHDLKQTMNSVRQQMHAFGVVSRKEDPVHTLPTVQRSPSGALQSNAELDQALFAAADRVERQLVKLTASDARNTNGGVKRTVALSAKERVESRQEQAARFFATHGLSSAGKLLGLDMAGQNEAAPQQSQNTPVHDSAAVPSEAVENYKSQWGAVDSLRLRHKDVPL